MAGVFIPGRMVGMEPPVEATVHARRFRLRAVPVSIAGAIGIACFAFGASSLLTSLSSGWAEVLDSIWLLILGSCFLASSALWWKGRYWTGAALIVVCLLFPVALFAYAMLHTYVPRS